MNKLVKYIKDNGLVVGIIITITLVLVGVLLTEHRANELWQAFKVDHECEIVGREKSRTFLSTNYSSTGSTSTSIHTIPARTLWLCDDGITYRK